MNTNKNSDNGVKTKFRINRKLLFFLLSLLPLIVVISWCEQGRREGLRKEQEARTFLQQIINSINDDTDFYKENMSKRNISLIEMRKDKISHNYEISIIDYELGYYEYNVIFDKEHKFYVVVIDYYGNGKFDLSRFKPVIPPLEQNFWDVGQEWNEM